MCRILDAREPCAAFAVKMFVVFCYFTDEPRPRDPGINSTRSDCWPVAGLGFFTSGAYGQSLRLAELGRLFGKYQSFLHPSALGSDFRRMPICTRDCSRDS